MKSFEIPTYYRSPIIGKIKNARKKLDPRKKDFSPSEVDFGAVSFLIPRHFGFCYGVENAIEISYKALKENPGKRIFLLSQMIHNPEVNRDLEEHGIGFIMDTEGNQFVDWDEITPEDVVIIPAFGTTIEIENLLREKGIETQEYNTTCPFVEKVWKRSKSLGADDFTVIIHGKHKHEETRATFSHSYQDAPAVVVKNMEESETLADFITGARPLAEFYAAFEGKYSEGFDPDIHLQKVGVVNQTTMLATETQAIADFFKQTMQDKFGADNLKNHFADTRDTLCYATNDNQRATAGVLEKDADLAIVVGGYNSSNTSHIVELCEEAMPTFFIKSADEIESAHVINHFNYPKKQMERTENWLPSAEKVRIVLTSGASCPDSAVDRVMQKVLSYFEGVADVETTVDKTIAEIQ
ncbi:MAG TPA: 4-hydroxy-3-methylbut-2-enyl diphosphate reductase [Cryomorphaceae bacterium]|nr:4-hydroxy-3-methylbut-2-enyl diphosphate reductase [Cryomorphaceae bacterium]